MRGCLPFAALLLCGPVASAHTISKSQSTWRFDDAGARIELRILRQELDGWVGGPPPTNYWPAHLQLSRGHGICPAGPVAAVPDAGNGWAVFRWEVRCPDPGPRSLHSSLLQGEVPQHIHLARIVDTSGVRREHVLVGSDPVWTIDATSGSGTSLAAYLWLGIGHILGGWDHLAFVVALALLIGSWREIIRLVTGFTVAHSLTLGLAATGVLRPEPATVEFLIGASIALVAAENCWLLGGRGSSVPVLFSGALAAGGVLALASFGGLAPLTWFGLALFSYCHFRLTAVTDRVQAMRTTVAFIFGLVHGFGFGGALMEIGLPPLGVVPALLGFNLGVECGQLIVVAIVYPALRFIALRSARQGRFVAEACSAAVFAVGVYWIVIRSW